jgi:hypothetical protein
MNCGPNWKKVSVSGNDWTYKIRSEKIRIPHGTRCLILWKYKHDRKCIILTEGVHDGEKVFCTQVNLLEQIKKPIIPLTQFIGGN